MNTQNKEKIAEIPIALGAVALGFMSISTALVEFDISWVRHVAVIYSVICIALLLMKSVMHPQKVANEIKNPLLGSIYPTIFMTLMVISVYIAQYSQVSAQVLWVFALVSHFLLSLIFFTERFKNFKIVDIIPSWFVPTVGIGVAAVTSKPIGLPSIANIVFYYTVALFIVVGPIIIYRVFFMEKLEGPKKATLMIMAAPANICLASYIAISNEPNKAFITVLAILSYASTIGVFILIPKLIKGKVLPVLAPLTFPLAIGVIASQRYVKYLGKIESPLQALFNSLVYVQVIVSVLVIGYVVYRAIGLLIKIFNKNGSIELQKS